MEKYLILVTNVFIYVPVFQSGGGGGIVLIFLVMLFVTTVLIAWAYSDAKKNSSHPAFLWAFVVFFAPLLGLILYVLLGRDQKQSQSGVTPRPSQRYER